MCKCGKQLVERELYNPITGVWSKVLICPACGWMFA
jgi:hypothetical protein